MIRYEIILIFTDFPCFPFRAFYIPFIQLKIVIDNYLLVCLEGFNDCKTYGNG